MSFLHSEQRLHVTKVSIVRTYQVNEIELFDRFIKLSKTNTLLHLFASMVLVEQNRHIARCLKINLRTDVMVEDVYFELSIKRLVHQIQLVRVNKNICSLVKSIQSMQPFGFS